MEENNNEKQSNNVKFDTSYKNEFEEKNLNFFVAKYGGAVIGGLIALILCFTRIYTLLIYIVIVLVGMYLGNYVQKNKPNVKEKLKEIIDKF